MTDDAAARLPMSFGRGLNSLRIRFTILIGVFCASMGWMVDLWLTSGQDGAVRGLGNVGVLLMGSLVAASCTITYLMTGKLTRPIENLKASTEAIAQGDFETAVSVDCNCEVGGLADSFRKMVARLNDNVAKINTLAYEDGVTGLPNRAVLDEVMQNLKGVEGYVLFIDLDRFKQVNDIYGHQTGDALLRKAAQRMLLDGLAMDSNRFRNCMVPSQMTVAPDGCRLLFRFAGDEFVALVVGRSSEEEIADLARQIIDRLSTPFTVEDRRIHIGASVGIVDIRYAAGDPMELIKFADLAMYEAKKAGRGSFAFFDERMRQRATEQLEMENDFARAITRREIIVHYQPKFSLKDGSLCGLEALARWRHPVRGLLYPGSFIEVIGSIGALDKIGREVMTHAAADSLKLRSAGMNQRIAINVCPTQFADDAFADNLIAFAQSLGASPHDFELEVTETIAMTDVGKANEHMNALKAAGFEISIDDFGTGYSNLSQLTRLPYDNLKIDRSLIADIVHNQQTITVVMAVVNMAHSLGRKIVVEGVEEKEQLDLMKLMGCDIVQGYYTGRPVELETILETLQKPAEWALPARSA